MATTTDFNQIIMDFDDFQDRLIEASRIANTLWERNSNQADLIREIASKEKENVRARKAAERKAESCKKTLADVIEQRNEMTELYANTKQQNTILTNKLKESMDFNNKLLSSPNAPETATQLMLIHNINDLNLSLAETQKELEETEKELNAKTDALQIALEALNLNQTILLQLLTDLKPHVINVLSKNSNFPFHDLLASNGKKKMAGIGLDEYQAVIQNRAKILAEMKED